MSTFGCGAARPRERARLLNGQADNACDPPRAPSAQHAGSDGGDPRLLTLLNALPRKSDAA